MTTLGSSLKATARPRKIEEDPIAGLKRAQADYEAADAGFRTRQREILQDVFRNVAGLIDDEEARSNFINDKGFAKYTGNKGDSSTDADRGDVWFQALAYVYQATSRARRQRASKHASALRLLYEENVEAEQIAVTIEKRGGLQKLVDEAAKARRRGGKESTTRVDAEPEQENGEASDDAEVQGTDEDDVEPEAENGEENDDVGVGDVEEAADADHAVRFSISEKLRDNIHRYRGARIKIIARVPRKMDAEIKVLKVAKLSAAHR